MMGAGRKKDFAQALSYVEELYPNMAVLSQLANYLEDPNSSLEDVVRLIRSESALTADIIKISNSSFYSASERCSDVDTALTRIGFNEVLRVVALILAKEICSNDLLKYGISANELWAESLSVSLLTEGLASSYRLNKSKAATFGILHNIGKVVINNILEDFRIDIFWDPTIPVSGWETAVAGFHYGEAGSRLLKKMNFPVEGQRVIRNHVDPAKAAQPDLMTKVLSYSVQLAECSGPGFSKKNYKLPHVDLFGENEMLEESILLEIVSVAERRFSEINREVFG